MMTLDHPLVIAGLVVLLIVVLVLASQRRRTQIITVGPPARTTAAPALATDAELRRLLAANQKIAAIKRVRELTGMGLQEAKAFIEALEGVASHATSTGAASPLQSTDLAAEARRVLQQEGKLTAIKRVRTLSGMGLKEAKEFVERL